jgi:hypothetical protein
MNDYVLKEPRELDLVSPANDRSCFDHIALSEINSWMSLIER